MVHKQYSNIMVFPKKGRDPIKVIDDLAIKNHMDFLGRIDKTKSTLAYDLYVIKKITELNMKLNILNEKEKIGNDSFVAMKSLINNKKIIIYEPYIDFFNKDLNIKLEYKDLEVIVITFLEYMKKKELPIDETIFKKFKDKVSCEVFDLLIKNNMHSLLGVRFWQFFDAFTKYPNKELLLNDIKEFIKYPNSYYILMNLFKFYNPKKRQYLDLMSLEFKNNRENWDTIGIVNTIIILNRIFPTGLDIISLKMLFKDLEISFGHNWKEQFRMVYNKHGFPNELLREIYVKKKISGVSKKIISYINSLSKNT